MQPPVFHFLTTLQLRHEGDCSLLGVTPDLTVYAEEIYAPEGWLAQHALTLDGTFRHSVDEMSGTNADVEPLALPPDRVAPRSGWQTMALNFSGPRHRGLRAPERVADVVQPLSIDEKMALTDRLKLGVLPPMLLGLAESYVLGEALLVHPSLFFVCRRLRLAVALPEQRIDEQNEPYDYDTVVCYVAHFHDTQAEARPLIDLLSDVQGVTLHRPMDCLLYADHLFIADGGAAGRSSAIHVFRVEHIEKPLTPEEKLYKKIYG